MRPKTLLLTTRPDNSEMEELVFALGSSVAATLHQRRAHPDPQFFLGRGKMEEARNVLVEAGARLVVVNGQLKPGQIFNLEQLFDQVRPHGGRVEVYDRTRLILEIFRQRAHSPEARLQVELAQLHYDMPLVKEYIHLAKKGEHPGFLAGGEYEVNHYYDMMKKRMARIRRDLDKIRRERGVRRKHRRRGGFHLVSLAGYTNAGKSSLLRALSDRETLVEDRYFSTLSTKTARAQSRRREILLTDTVGFIEDLPPWMVEAFHSTLEEIALADVVLLVLDASDPLEEMARRLRSSLRILWEFEGQEEADSRPRISEGWSDWDASGPGRFVMPHRHRLAPILVALNKVDQVSGEDLQAKCDALDRLGLLDPARMVHVSAVTGQGIEDLYAALYELIPDYDDYEVALQPSPESEALIGWLHEHADVLDLTRGNEVHLHFEAKRSLAAAVQDRLRQAGAVLLKEAQRGLVPQKDNGEPESGEGPMKTPFQPERAP